MRDRLIPAGILLVGFLLRGIGLGVVPPAVNSDEWLKAFDGASVYRTGRDHHGESWPLFFRQSGEYSPPLYIYFAGLFSAPFGVNARTTRLPSAVLGTVSILLVYGFVKAWEGRRVALAAAALAALSPWGVHYSRIGWEAVTLGPLLLGGLWAWVGWTRTFRLSRLAVSALCFALSFYAYPAARVFVPLLVSGMAWAIRRSK